MARIVVVGAGMVGLGAALLLGQDEHEVVVLERDPTPPPALPAAAWDGWQRRGVNQFRLPHAFLGRFRSIVDSELPDVAKALDEAGALRINFIRDVLPPSLTAGWQDGDEAYELLTGRRPLMEAVLAAVTENTPGVTVRRGTRVTGLAVGPSGPAGVPHVTGVRTATGVVSGDLVVDVTGRRSPLPGWLQAVGARRPVEEAEDCGFIYFSRHFRSTDGSFPTAGFPGLQHLGTISSLCLPADNGTWSLALVTAATDRALLGLREVSRWQAAVAACPLIAPWLDGEPLDNGVNVMAKLEDRLRCFVVDGTPVATGVVPLADSWSCTNPSLGRGVSIGMMHAAVLRDQIRSNSLADPEAFVDAFYAATSQTVEPWYRATVTTDRHRLAEIQAEIHGESYVSADPAYLTERAMTAASRLDPTCLRAYLSSRFLLRSPGEVLADETLAARIHDIAADRREDRLPGPTRSHLLTLASA